MNLRQALSFLEDAQAQKKGMRIWFLLVLGWSVIRSVIVSRVFASYGLNSIQYFLIDFISSIPYAYTSGKSLIAYVAQDVRKAFYWLIATVIFFYVPDIFILLTTHQVPSSTYIGFGIVLFILSWLALSQWKEKRR
jgi:hypothetical protein